MGRADFEPRLESLRGIAALIVAAAHGMMAFTEGLSASPSILMTITGWLLWVTNPAAAVCFFFVLSGYVLGRALERDGEFFPYVVRRAFRIAPMFLVSLLFAYVCVTLVRIDPAPSDITGFFKRPFWPTPDISQLWDNLLFRSSWINGPSWSIYPEIIGSLALPLLVYGHKRASGRWQWPLFIFVTIALAFSDYRLVIWFYCGFFLPSEVAKLAGERWTALFFMFAAGYLILRYASEFAVYYKMKTIAPTAIGASMMIGAVVASRDFLAWLSIRPLRFVGRTSFSFYLLHWPIFYLTWVAYMQTSLPHGYIGNLIVCVFSIVSALIVSAATFALIESPAMEIARRMARRSPALTSADEVAAR